MERLLDLCRQVIAEEDPVRVDELSQLLREEVARVREELLFLLEETVALEN